MNREYRIVLLLIVTMTAPSVLATAAVDSVNFPAWVERDSRPRALAPGEALVAGDEIRTGDRGRVWLAFDDGSVVKLGSNARFKIERAEFTGSADSSLMQAAFAVLRGAFRFTSGFFKARRPAAHRVDMRVGAITVGIRGTDIWGRSGEDEDFVALLEGRIEVGADGTAPQPMQQALTLFAKPRGEPVAPIRAVDMATIESLAPETELDAAAGIAGIAGNFALVLMSLQNEDWVQSSLARFAQAGYPVETRAAVIDGRTHTRLLLRGLADRTAAENLRRQMAAEFGLEDIWITQTTN